MSHPDHSRALAAMVCEQTRMPHAALQNCPARPGESRLLGTQGASTSLRCRQCGMECGRATARRLLGDAS